jgi:hypothetical protein
LIVYIAVFGNLHLINFKGFRDELIQTIIIMVVNCLQLLNKFTNPNRLRCNRQQVSLLFFDNYPKPKVGFVSHDVIDFKKLMDLLEEKTFYIKLIKLLI